MAEVGIFVGTMYGNSLLVAEEAEAILSGLGHKATVYEDPQVNDWESYTGKYVLVVTSTTGQGDLPDSIVPLYEGIKDMYQPHLRYGHYRARRQHLCQLLRRRPEVRSAAAGAGREAQSARC
ncbi:flavoprotein YqcA [Klebsiella pneumoniae]|uniref:Flavoprotein YqcA n=1 Tax=Klebsiella pneumoniae TaxID=573 RepID=A0A2X1QH73_KLEPN|nr:flavoprotein YqcA [Klebsiella pneumoniae]